MCQLVPFSESEAAQSAEVVRPFDADVHRLEETLPAHLPIEEETLPVVAEERSSHASRSDGRCDWVHGLNVASLSLCSGHEFNGHGVLGCIGNCWRSCSGFV